MLVEVLNVEFDRMMYRCIKRRFWRRSNTERFTPNFDREEPTTETEPRAILTSCPQLVKISGD